jgi:hypothetical protein
MTDRYKNEPMNTPEQKLEELRNKASRLEKQNKILLEGLSYYANRMDSGGTARRAIEKAKEAK